MADAQEKNAYKQWLLKYLTNRWLLGGAALLLIVGVLAFDFFTTLRAIDISNTSDLDARGGQITIRYSRPSQHINYQTSGGGLHVRSELSDDGLTETHTLTYPTKYKQQYKLKRTEQRFHYKLFGLFLPPRTIALSVGIEEVAIKGMIPPENSSPAPGTMDNQLAIQFKGEIRGKYKKDVNIPVDEMEFARLSPRVNGYYRWVDDSTLTFNFAESKPEFETTYAFEVFPDKFINAEYQKWVGEKTKIQVTTSTNEVYVTDFSLSGEVHWRAPLRIEFSGNMVGALDVLKKKSQSVIPITISPKAGGVWSWVNARTLEFQPDEASGWPVRKTVTVSIFPRINTDKERKWRKGRKPDEYSFYVLPRQQSITSYSLHGVTQPWDDLIVRFSRNMVDEAQLRQEIPNDRPADNIPLLFSPEVRGSFVWVAEDKLKFHPANLWSQLTEYTVRLNPRFNPDQRYEWTGTKEFKFETAENVVYAEFFLTPEHALSPSAFFSNKARYAATEGVRPEERLWLLFDKDLGRFVKEGVDLSEAVVITPPIKGQFTWLSHSLLEFVPEDNWDEETSYSVKLTKALLHHPEQHFSKGQDSFNFATGPNIVRISSVGRSMTDPDEPLMLEPDRALVLEFSKDMNTVLNIGKRYDAGEVVPESLPVIIEPKLDMTVQWRDRRQMTLQPKDYWQPQTLYTVRLNPKLLPQTQAKYEHGEKFYIKTTKNIVRIDSFTPQGMVGRRVVVDVLFNKRLKPADIAVGGQDTAGLFRIEPALDGKWVWLADDKLQFKPSTPLTSSTSYSVSFDPNKIQDKQFSWHVPVSEKDKKYPLSQFRFHTQALQVSSSQARFEFNEKDILKQRFYLDMKLSAAVNAKDLRRHFSIWYEKPTDDGKLIDVPLVYKLQTREGAAAQVVQEFSVVSDWIERPSNDRRIKYMITAGLKPVTGNLELATDYSSFFLQEKPKHIRINRVEWEWKDRAYKAIMALSAPVEPEALRRFLKIVHVPADDEDAGNKLAYEIAVHSSGTTRDFKYEVSAKFIPGSKHKFTIAEGLLAADGAFTPDPVALTSDTPDISKKLEFALNGSILSRQDLAKVPVLSTNTDAFTITIDRIFASNVSYFVNNSIDKYDISDIAKTVHKKRYKVKNIIRSDSVKNREIISHIDLSELAGKNIHGLYRITVSENNQVRERSQGNSRWFLATDIGLVARRFGNNMVLWTNSLHTLDSLKKVKIEVFDRWNQVIGTGSTDSRGFAEIRLDHGAIPAHVIAKKDDDFCFLDMGKHRDRLSGYDVEGISSQKSSIRTFIYSDRGVYRPGDTVHLVAVTRGKEGMLPHKFPVTFRINNPTGKEIIAENYTVGEDGLYVYDFEVPATAKTGKWQTMVLWKGDSIGNYAFQVEEFIPNKIKVDLELLNRQLTSSDTLKFKVKGKNLFGPPAAGRTVNGSIKLRAHYFKPKGHRGFLFGHSNVEFQRIDAELVETKLDEDGAHVYEYAIPENIDSPIGLRAHYSATVIDDGGRGVSSYGETDVLLYSQYVGVRRLEKGIINLETPVGFEIVNVEADGSAIVRQQQKLKFRIYRNKRVTHYRKNERGYYRYVTEKERVLVDELPDPRDAQGKFTYMPKYSGEHVLEVEDAVGKQTTHQIFVVRGPADGTQIVEAADKVALAVLNTRVDVDDEVKLEIRTPILGKLLLVGEREEVLFTRVLDMTEHKRIISIPMSEKHLPNFYISAMAIKPVNQGNRHDPIYAVGLTNVTVEDKSHTPVITLKAPKRASPNGEMTVQVKIGDTNDAPVYYTIAAVDEGILQLTQYKVPNMQGYFNQKRRLEVDHYSMYPLVMPYEPDVKHIITPSGDAPSRALIKKKRVSPHSEERVKSVALWSGLLKTNEDGEGTASFKLPDFDGTLRVMAVAFGDQRFASAQQETLVRDKLVVKPTLPRFLATGDDFIIPVNLFNGTDRDDDITVTIQASDHVTLRGTASKRVAIDRNGEHSLSFALRVEHEVGVASFEITAEGAGETTRKIIKVPVRSPGTTITHSGNGSVDKNQPKSVVLPGGFFEGTQELVMKVTSSRLAKFQNGLTYLLRYPHGCLEQTTSRLFPLLYYSDIATSAGDIFSPKKTPRYYVREGISKIERMQLENGSFAYWPGRNLINNWSFIYASHFLVEAQKAGYKISDVVWNNMLHQLNQMVSTSFTRDQLYHRDRGVSHYLYALYILALADENVLSKLNYVYDNYFEQLKPHDKARMASAYATSGDSDKAKDIIGALTGFSEYDDPYRDTGGQFASSIRDLAIVLDALATVEPTSSQIPVLVDRLADKSRYGRWGSTQENAFAFLALGKALSKSESLKTKAKIVLGDGTIVPFDKELLLATPELLKGEVRIEVSGKGEVAYVWEAVGIEKDPKSLQKDEGLRVRRRYLDNRGEELDLKNVKQGDLVVAEIRIESRSSKLDNIVITDLLPTGLEIENARLSTSAALPWVQSDVSPDYVDIRDDRINIFLTVPTNVVTYYYTTRAVTMGNFKIPAVHAEAMYNPDIFSESSGGQLKIIERATP